MSKIAQKRIGDILNFKRGYDLPAKSRRSGEYPVISSAGISGLHDQFKAEGEGLITGRYGTLGEVHYIEGRYWPHNTALYVTDFKGNHPKYLYYLLRQIGHVKTSDKSAVPGINRNDLHEVILPVVTCPKEQTRIAAVLSALDAKIALNQRINHELEGMAKLLYDYWFVQYDFPLSAAQAAALGKPRLAGQPYRTSGGKMVFHDHLKREIPKGWRAAPLGKVVSKIIDHRGKTPTKLGGEWSENLDDIIALSAKHVKNGTLVDLQRANRVNPALYEKWMPEKLADGDVLMTSEAPAGEFYFINGDFKY